MTDHLSIYPYFHLSISESEPIFFPHHLDLKILNRKQNFWRPVALRSKQRKCDVMIY